jgi:hypothetical protein
MRYILVSLFIFVSAMFACAQSPCTEAAIKQGRLPMADNSFSCMPPFGKPLSGKSAIQETAGKKFGACSSSSGTSRCKAVQGDP